MFFILLSKQNLTKVIFSGAIALGIFAAGIVTTHADTTKTIESGDTLNKIAADYQTNVNDLVKLNNIDNADMIYAGEKLIISKDCNEAPVVQSEDTQETPVQEPVAEPTQEPVATVSEPVQETTPVTDNSSYSDGSLDSIAEVESNNDYNATNGQYIGKYQLSSSYLNGDYSPANQEKVAREYAVSRYGSVEAAVNFRANHNYW